MKVNNTYATPIPIKRGRSLMSFATAAVSLGDKYRITKHENSLTDVYVLNRDKSIYSTANYTIGTGIGDKYSIEDDDDDEDVLNDNEVKPNADILSIIPSEAPPKDEINESMEKQTDREDFPEEAPMNYVTIYYDTEEEEESDLNVLKRVICNGFTLTDTLFGECVPVSKDRDIYDSDSDSDISENSDKLDDTASSESSMSYKDRRNERSYTDNDRSFVSTEPSYVSFTNITLNDTTYSTQPTSLGLNTIDIDQRRPLSSFRIEGPHDMSTHVSSIHPSINRVTSHETSIKRVISHDVSTIFGDLQSRLVQNEKEEESTVFDGLNSDNEDNQDNHSIEIVAGLDRVNKRILARHNVYDDSQADERNEKKSVHFVYHDHDIKHTSSVKSTPTNNTRDEQTTPITSCSSSSEMIEDVILHCPSDEILHTISPSHSIEVISPQYRLLHSPPQAFSPTSCMNVEDVLSHGEGTCTKHKPQTKMVSKFVNGFTKTFKKKSMRLMDKSRLTNPYRSAEI